MKKCFFIENKVGKCTTSANHFTSWADERPILVKLFYIKFITKQHFNISVNNLQIPIDFKDYCYIQISDTVICIDALITNCLQ